MAIASAARNDVIIKHKSKFGISFYVRVLWSVLSFLVSIACTYSFFRPQWFVNSSTGLCMGLINFCYEDSLVKLPHKSLLSTDYHEVQKYETRWQFNTRINFDRLDVTGHGKQKFKICRVYGVSRFRLHHMPSNSWQISFILLGIGCLLGCTSALLSLVTVSTDSTLWNKKLACYTAFLQALAALLLSSGLTILPLGLDSKLAQYICKSSLKYNLGKCDVGWPYILSVMATSLSFFCPFLSRHINLDKTSVEKEAIHL